MGDQVLDTDKVKDCKVASFQNAIAAFLMLMEKSIKFCVCEPVEKFAVSGACCLTWRDAVTKGTR